MTRLLKALSEMIIKQFKFFWIALTFVFLFFVLYLNWGLGVKRSNNELSRQASAISNNIDGFVEDLFQEVYTLPVYGKNFADCKTELHPFLEHIMLNTPNISALSITDSRNQAICSTLPENEAIISASARARTIRGPFSLSTFDQPVFLIQQKMGNYYISIFVVASILREVLKTNDQSINSIALYNSYEKKNIIQVEKHKIHNRWY